MDYLRKWKVPPIYSTRNIISASVPEPIPTAGGYSPTSNEHVPIRFYLEIVECVGSAGDQEVSGGEADGFSSILSFYTSFL